MILKIKKQNLIIVILGSLIAISPFSIDMYLPAFPAIATSLHTDIAHVGYSLTSYYVGLCAGQLIYGILIDRFGRRKPLIAGLLIYIAAALGCAMAPGINSLVTIRLLMALGGCVGLVTSRAIVRDLFPPEDTAKILSQLVLIMGVAPIIAPTIGGLVNTLLGWRWIFGLMSVAALVLMTIIIRFLPETKEPDASISLRLENIFPAYLTVLKHASFWVYSLAGGISYAGMFAYIAGSPFVFMEKFGLSDTTYGWAFAFNACGLIIGSQLNRLALKRNDSPKICLRAGTMLFIVGLSLTLVTVLGFAGPWLTLCFTFLFLFCLGFINPNATALALKPFTSAAGRASAVLGSIQMIAGAAASWFVSFFHNGSIVVMPMVMFGCTIITLILLLAYKRNSNSAPVKSLS
jgi:DHA1 family bicyclomycin/chloramphenicol resistance-like MFS transporter